MTVTLLAALLALAVTGLLLAALLRRGAATEGSAASIYEDQLGEIERDRERGLLDDDQAARARAEVERRLLDAARRERREDAGQSRPGRLALAAMLGALPLAAGGLYGLLGSPTQPDTSFAARRAAGPDVAALRDELLADPDDLEGWVRLAEALGAGGQWADAAPAYAQAVRLTGGQDRRLAGRYAEALVLSADEVTPEAEAVFAAIKSQHPNDPQATYWLAQAKAARGETDEAAADLQALLTGASPSSPWYAGVSQLLVELTEGSGAPPAPPGPDAAQVEAATALPDPERDAMIRAMVERLDARLREQPDDVEGWRRLARSYDVLGEELRARQAWAEVAAREPGDPEAETALGRAP